MKITFRNLSNLDGVKSLDRDAMKRVSGGIGLTPTPCATGCLKTRIKCLRFPSPDCIPDFDRCVAACEAGPIS